MAKLLSATLKQVAKPIVLEQVMIPLSRINYFVQETFKLQRSICEQQADAELQVVRDCPETRNCFSPQQPLLDRPVGASLLLHLSIVE